MKNGVVYTPQNIVRYMLDKVGYNNASILGKHVIDNSCGTGAFLVEILSEYIIQYQKQRGDLSAIETDLEKYIHGVEIDKSATRKAINNLNRVLDRYNIPHVNWDIVNADSFLIKGYDRKMDFVIGNPPYIRVHDLSNDNMDNLKLIKNGMKDIYIAFFEIGINMLNDTGKLIYITPNSFFNSTAGLSLRRRLIDDNLLDSIYNLGHYNPFRNATTYTAITLLQKNVNQNKTIKYFNYNGEKTTLIQSYLNKEFFIDDLFYFSDKYYTNLFYQIRKNGTQKKIVVKNGVATNLDAFFFKQRTAESPFVIKSYKISTGKYGWGFFPYYEDGHIVPFDTLDELMKDDLKIHEEPLRRRDLRGNEWYGFARTQGIKDTQKIRICVNGIVKNIANLKVEIVDKNCVVYGGYYILSDEKYYDTIIKEIKSDKFMGYVKTLNKQKNGDYYTFSSKDLEKYLNYVID